MTRKLILTLAVGAAIPGLALAQGMNMGGNPADKANMETMQEMQNDMPKHAYSGDADRDFVMMMIPHHQGAIDMARVELQHGKDPQLKKLAEMIVSAQVGEIKELKEWQSKHQ